MIAFTFEEIFKSVISSIFFGALFGAAYRISNVIFVFLHKLLFIFYDSLKLAGNISKENLKEAVENRKKRGASEITKNVLDFFFFLIFGIGTIILTYAVTDGIFRLYVILTVILFFFVSKELVTDKISLIIDKLLNKLHKTILLFFAVLVSPIRKIFLFAVKYLREKHRKKRQSDKKKIKGNLRYARIKKRE
jgi:hypothetical protein